MKMKTINTAIEGKRCSAGNAV